jgi:hypothetical protein
VTEGYAGEVLTLPCFPDQTASSLQSRFFVITYVYLFYFRVFGTIFLYYDNTSG